MDLATILAAIQKFINSLEPKDVATLCTSIFALIVSLLTYSQRASEARNGQRKHLTEIIEKLHETSVENARYRDPVLSSQYPRDYDRLINDRRRFLVRQAKYLAERLAQLVSPFEKAIIAQGLQDANDFSEAEDWFKAAIKRSKHEHDKLIIIRQYARVLFRNGQASRARKQFEKACAIMKGDHNQSHNYLGDTYERWAALEFDFGDKEKVEDLIDRAITEYRQVYPDDFSKSLQDRLKPLAKKMADEKKAIA